MHSNQKIKAMLKKFYDPTPKRWRKLGDALLGISLLGIPAELTGHSSIAIGIFLCGVVGKFLTNFFSDEI